MIEHRSLGQEFRRTSGRGSDPCEQAGRDAPEIARIGLGSCRYQSSPATAGVPRWRVGFVWPVSSVPVSMQQFPYFPRYPRWKEPATRQGKCRQYHREREMLPIFPGSGLVHPANDMLGGREWENRPVWKLVSRSTRNRHIHEGLSVSPWRRIRMGIEFRCWS